MKHTKQVETVPSLPPLKTPTLEKTFGEISFQGKSALHFSYKTMKLASDPVPFKNKIPFDYLFLSDSQARHANVLKENGVRKNLKILSPPKEKETLRSWGYSMVKGLSTQQKVLLKKDEGYLFATAHTYENSKTKKQVNSYFLEFDNGRNVFLSGDVSNLETMREFLYTLRDDGKEIHLAFLYGTHMNENFAGDIISLLQPKIAYLMDSNLDQRTLKGLLEEKIYFGEVGVLKPGESVPF